MHVSHSFWKISRVLPLFLLLFSLAFSEITLAACGISVDPDGDTIPTPTGNIPYFQLPEVLCAGEGEFTWDYSGTLENSSQKFSFQSSIFQTNRLGTLGLGFHIFQFGFKDNNYLFYGNSTYGGESHIAEAISQSVDWIRSSSTAKNFLIKTSLILNPAYKWVVKSYVPRVPEAPLYKGWVGQPGHQYQMSGTGKTFLWRYDSTGASVIAPYTYDVDIIMLDERGAVMEGLGGGYVGPSLVPTPTSSTYLVESEVAQPRLKITSWRVKLKSEGAPKAGFKSAYAFSGKSGMLWNDFGPVVTVNNTIGSLSESTMPLAISQLQNTMSSESVAVIESINKSSGASLYNGNWIPVMFTSGKYKGSAIVFFTFWNKTVRYPNDQTTNDPSWSTVGWVNLFTGVVPNKVASSSSLLETLYQENPDQPTTFLPTPPYTVKLDTFVPAYYHLAFPWVQKATLTIKANTKLRYALADYANTYYPNQGYDDPNQDLQIIVTAISPVTQNTLFTKSFSQYYEGAAVPTINGNVVGYAWLEHMVKN